jgi:hypothetical protein
MITLSHGAPNTRSGLPSSGGEARQWRSGRHDTGGGSLAGSVNIIEFIELVVVGSGDFNRRR